MYLLHDKERRRSTAVGQATTIIQIRNEQKDGPRSNLETILCRSVSPVSRRSADSRTKLLIRQNQIERCVPAMSKWKPNSLDKHTYYEIGLTKLSIRALLNVPKAIWCAYIKASASLDDRNTFLFPSQEVNNERASTGRGPCVFYTDQQPL